MRSNYVNEILRPLRGRSSNANKLANILRFRAKDYDLFEVAVFHKKRRKFYFIINSCLIRSAISIQIMKILFVCSRNKWRSRTAETIFKNNGLHQIKSAGTEKSARIRITQSLINWADTIFVMEEKHKKRIFEKFEIDHQTKNLEVLDIPDEYQYMDDDLVEILEIKLKNLL